MLRDGAVVHALNSYRRRLRFAALSAVVVASAAVGGLVLVLAWALDARPIVTRAFAVAMFFMCAAGLGVRAWQRWSLMRVASMVESRVGGLDNLVVTAEELARRDDNAVHAAIAAEVERAAQERLTRVPASAVQPLTRPLTLGAGAIVALAAMLVALPEAQGPSTSESLTAPAVDESALPAAGDVHVAVTAPPYARRATTLLVNPPSVTVLEGSRIELAVGRAIPATLVNLDGTSTDFAAEGERRVLDLEAIESRPLLIRFVPTGGPASDRLVHLRVQPDERPVVRIERPAEDLIFPDSTGQVAVTIAARDDVALEELALKYTKVSGSGENFTFQEGDWPIRIERSAAGDWTARAEFSLAALNLQDGDTLVYRAVARDGKPGADPSLSDSYLIEVGRVAGVASTGFALPEERDRQAISQQMLIIKTERLHADRTKLSQEAFVEQSRLLAIEQRMVKAEFEFMTGGVVEDEFEEAAHSHELAEGRFENIGQIELITAIREMARAEARLNTADTTQALVHERAALRALQRAFDRRRYLLRTLPERARIDLSRRLSGELDTARSSSQNVGATTADPFLDRAREMLRELDVARDPATATALASRLLALDNTSEELQQAALHMAAAPDATGLAASIREAQRLVVASMTAHLAKASAATLERDPLAGRLVQELLPGGPPP